jgi:hypothetical protein
VQRSLLALAIAGMAVASIGSQAPRVRGEDASNPAILQM